MTKGFVATTIVEIHKSWLLRRDREIRTERFHWLMGSSEGDLASGHPHPPPLPRLTVSISMKNGEFIGFISSISSLG